MNSIMVDNWLMQEVVAETYSEEKSISDGYAKFLTAIVLWDDVYYPDNEMSIAWNLASREITSCLHSFCDNKKLFEKEASELYEKQYAGYPDVIAKGAIRYLLLSDYINCDYFPSGERRSFLDKNSPYGIIKELNRFNYINTLDYSISEQYNEIFNRFGMGKFKIKRPVLVDFILQNAPNNMSYIDFAMHLKYERAVVQYREYLNDVEKAIEKNEWNVWNEMIQYSDDAVKKVISMDKKSIGTVNVTVAPMPSLNFSKDICIGRRKVHLSFLEDLSKFAFCGRRMF